MVPQKARIWKVGCLYTANLLQFDGHDRRLDNLSRSAEGMIRDALTIFPSLVPPWLLYLLCGRRWPRHQRRLVQPRGRLSRATRHRGLPDLFSVFGGMAPYLRLDRVESGNTVMEEFPDACVPSRMPAAPIDRHDPRASRLKPAYPSTCSTPSTRATCPAGRALCGPQCRCRRRRDDHGRSSTA